MNIHRTSHPQLYIAEGSIFDFKDGNFDGIIVFLESGFNDINAEYLRVKESLKVSPFPVLSFGNYGENGYPQHISEFPNRSAAIQFIYTAINQTLSTLASYGCKRIGIHGIRIYGIDDYYTEEASLRAINQWVCNHAHSIDFVIAVDRFNCYARHI